LSRIPGHAPGNKTNNTADHIPLNERTSYEGFEKNISTKSLRINEVPNRMKLKEIRVGGETPPTQRTEKEETVLNGPRIGHTRIARGFLLAREDAPTRQTCGNDLSVEHVISRSISDRTRYIP